MSCLYPRYKYKTCVACTTTVRPRGKQGHTRLRLFSTTPTRAPSVVTSSPMAFVHPSRMALVPKNSGNTRPSGSRLPSPPASPPRSQSSSANRGRDRSNDDRYPRRRIEEYGSERRNDRGRSSDRGVHRVRGRSPSRDRRNGDRHNGRRDESAEESHSREPRPQRDDRPAARSPSPSSRSPLGRASPRYDDYRRRNSTPPPPRSNDDGSRRPDMPPDNGAPWRQQENMYRRDGRFDGGGDYFER